MIYLTSDTHFAHARILELGAGRPFTNIEHHNEVLVRNWNSVVTPDDTVYHLGDVALGPWPTGLNYVARLNGYITLVPGNHDRIFSGMSHARQERFYDDYLSVFDAIMPETSELVLNGVSYVLSHFPYSEGVNNSTHRDRYRKHRPSDHGRTVIHGHTHQQEVVTRSHNGTQQVSVGVDAWNFTPVSWTTLEHTMGDNHVP